MNVLIIHNPWAGPLPANRVVRRAAAWWRARGWKVAVSETGGPGSAARLAHQAAQQGLDAVIVAGGDGTLSQAAAGLAGSETALGLLPVGTANVWAREVGLPIVSGWRAAPVENAARMLAEAAVRCVDLGRAGDRDFLLWLGLGLDGHIVSRIEPRGRIAKFLGIPYYVAAAIVAAAAWRGASLRVTIDGETLAGEFSLVMIGNVRRYGGGLFSVSPAASVDDGLLEVLVFEGANYADALARAWMLFRGRHGSDPRTTLRSARQVVVDGPRPLPGQADAEPFLAHLPLEITVRPRVLRVLAPPEAAPGLFSGPAGPVRP